jgi:hypothetical protein
MGRKARIIGQAVDVFDVEFDVREKRSTVHGFDLLIGWPVGQRGPGYGGPKVILTPELAAHLERFRHEPSALNLPIGAGAVKRIRALLGHHWMHDRAIWWEERLPEMLDMTIEDFAAKHGVCMGAVSQWRTRFVGPWLCHLENQLVRKHVQEAIRLTTKQACLKLRLSPAQIRRLRIRFG